MSAKMKGLGRGLDALIRETSTPTGPLPEKENGGLDLKQITCIQVESVEDYHD